MIDYYREANECHSKQLIGTSRCPKEIKEALKYHPVVLIDLL